MRAAWDYFTALLSGSAEPQYDGLISDGALLFRDGTGQSIFFSYIFSWIWKNKSFQITTSSKEKSQIFFLKTFHAFNMQNRKWFCPGTKKFVPGFLLLLLSRDKRTKGQRDVQDCPRTSHIVPGRPILSQDVPSLGNPSQLLVSKQLYMFKDALEINTVRPRDTRPQAARTLTMHVFV